MDAKLRTAIRGSKRQFIDIHMPNSQVGRRLQAAPHFFAYAKNVVGSPPAFRHIRG
jgi:hypothetical protein